MNNKGITMISLAIYISITMILLTIFLRLNMHFYKSMDIIKYEYEYALEFNKFNMFFIEDVKNNYDFFLENNKIIFEDGTIYEKKEDNLYRNNKKICSNINNLEVLKKEEKTVNNSTIKRIISVNLDIGKEERTVKTIDYVLKYW